MSVTGAGGNTIDAASGASVTESSTGDTFMGAGYSITLAADDLSATVAAVGVAVSDTTGVTGGTITFNGTGAWNAFSGNGATLTFGQNVDSNVFGSDTVSATAGGSQLSFYFGNSTVTADNALLYLNTGTSTAVSGGGNVLNNSNTNAIATLSNTGSNADTYDGTGGSIYLGSSGVNLTVNAAGASVVDNSGVTGGEIDFNGAGTWNAFNGNGASLTFGQNVNSNVFGSDTVSATAGGSALSFYSGNSTVTATNALLYLNTGTSTAVSGGGNLLDSVSPNNNVLVSNTGSVTDVYEGTGGSIYLGSNGVNLTVDAGGATIYMQPGAANANLTFDNGASADSYYDNGGSVVLNQGADVNILDGGVSITAAADSVANLSGGTSNVTANNATIDLNTNTVANVAGSGDIIWSNGVWNNGPTSGANLTGSGGDTLDGSGGLFNIGSSGMSLTLDAANSQIQTEAGVTDVTVNVANGVGQASFYGGGFTVNAGTGDSVSVGGTSGTDVFNWAAGDDKDGAASSSITFDPNSSDSSVWTDWSGSNGAGSMLATLTDFAAGGSQVEWFNPEKGINSATADYTGANQSGEITSETLNASSGYQEKLTFDYNSSGEETGYTEDYYAPSGGYLGDIDFNSDNEEIPDTASGEYGDYGSYDGGYDRAFKATAASGKGRSISTIAAYDLNSGQIGAAAAAEGASLQAQQTALSPASAGILAPSVNSDHWASTTITWAFATGNGTAASPISGAIGSQYQSLFVQAFASWASATGLTFTEVSDPSQADIQLGWGEFDAANSGVLGYTSSPTNNAGVLEAGAIVRLEDPSELGLVTDANGQLSYTGTSAELEQVILHEIGHAIGLGDSADPTSIMYSVADAQDATITSSDIAAVTALYDPSSASPGAASESTRSASVTSTTSTAAATQFAQAIAGFDVSPLGLASTPVNSAAVVSSTTPLAVNNPFQSTH